jgi:hypothetical protein
MISSLFLAGTSFFFPRGNVFTDQLQSIYDPLGSLVADDKNVQDKIQTLISVGGRRHSPSRNSRYYGQSDLDIHKGERYRRRSLKN